MRAQGLAYCAITESQTGEYQTFTLEKVVNQILSFLMGLVVMTAWTRILICRCLSVIFTPTAAVMKPDHSVQPNRVTWEQRGDW